MEEAGASLLPTSGNKHCRFQISKYVFSIEIPVLLFFVSFGIYTAAQLRFIYYRMCLRKYDESNSLCSAIDTNPLLDAAENDLQQDYSYYTTLLSILLNIPAAFTSICMGVICDRFSFRLPAVVVHLGSAACSTLLLIFSYFPAQATSPLLLCLPSLLNGLTGNIGTICTCGYAYASKVSGVNDRVLRIAAIDASVTLGAAAGFLFDGVLLRYNHPSLAFLVQIAINIYACFYIMAMVPDLHTKEEIQRHLNREANGSWLKFLLLPDFLTFSKHNRSNGLFLFFTNTATSLFRNRRIFLIIFTSTISSGCVFGLTGVLYEFLSSEPISLSASAYSIQQGASFFLGAFNLIVTVRLLKRCCSISAAALTLLGSISRTLAPLTLAFGDYFPILAPWLYCVVAMLYGVHSSGIRTMLSEATSERRRGAVFAATSFCETIANVVFAILFNAFYALSLSAVQPGSLVPPLLRGLIFFASASLQLAPTIGTIWLMNPLFL